MDLRTTCYIGNENDELIGLHGVNSDSEKILYALASGFNYVMCRYDKNNKVIFTPIRINKFKQDEEE